MTSTKSSVVVAAVVAALLVGGRGRAQELDPITRSCVESFEVGQELRQTGRLRQSRERLLACAQESCPRILRDKCQPWLAEVEAALPSLIVVARDQTGRDLVQAEVAIDDGPPRPLDGRGVAVDPGPHRLQVSHPGFASVERVVMVAEGQKDRLVVVELVAREPVDAPSAEPGLPGHFHAAVAVSATGLALGLATGIASLVRGAEIRDQCPELCPASLRDDYDEGLALAHVSTVSFVVAGVAGAIAVGVALLDAPAVEARLGPGGVTLVGAF